MTRHARIDRRHFLGALGLGGAAVALPGAAGWVSRARAGGAAEIPKRVVFFATPHGTVWNAWQTAVPGLAPEGITSSAPLSGVSELSPILAPLAGYESKMTVLENIARTVGFEYEHQGAITLDKDLNGHHYSQAQLLTCALPLQRPGATCIGGAESVDQVIGRGIGVPGRWASRVYGFNHQHPYNFVAPGEAAPRIQDPQQAFDDIMGIYTPPDASDGRATAITRARASALDLAAGEFDRVARRVGIDDRLKLERHAQLIRDLELSFSGTLPGASCTPSFTAMGHVMEQFARVTTLALACDMTRVVTFVSPDLSAEELGVAPTISVHQDLAHNSIANSGGSVWTPEAEAGMIEYNRIYARAFAYLLEQLDSVPEADGTLLDHTAVVWLTELGTGTHDTDRTAIVVAGGASGALRMGQWIRYAREHEVRGGWATYSIGPSHSQLYVSIMQALGMPDESFGIDSVPLADGSTLSLRGPLPELMT
jgi:hypothetical protein